MSGPLELPSGRDEVNNILARRDTERRFDFLIEKRTQANHAQADGCGLEADILSDMTGFDVDQALGTTAVFAGNPGEIGREDQDHGRLSDAMLVACRLNEFLAEVAGLRQHQFMDFRIEPVNTRCQSRNVSGNQIWADRVERAWGWSRSEATHPGNTLSRPKQLRHVLQCYGRGPKITAGPPHSQAPLKGAGTVQLRLGKADQRRRSAKDGGLGGNRRCRRHRFTAHG